MRDRLRAHQEQPQCANCHRKIDPIGFGLENFDAAGKWRTEDTYVRKGEGKRPGPWIPPPPSTMVPHSRTTSSCAISLSRRSDAFARGFTEALIEYALGRPFGLADEELAASIVNRARAKDFALREFIHALVASEAFHSK